MKLGLKSKRVILLLSCLGLLAIVSLPGPVAAVTVTPSVSATGSAFIDWSTLNITLGGVAFDPTLFFDPVLGFQSAFSGTQVQLNGSQTEVGLADYGDGSLPTSSFVSLTNLNGSSVTAQAQTTTNAVPPALGTTTGLSASLTMSLNAPDVAFIDPVTPNQAQATFYDFAFIAPSAGLLSVTVNYALNNLLSSNSPFGVVASNAFAGLFLYGYDIDGNPLNDPSALATAVLNNSLLGVGTTGPLSSTGTLALQFNLVAGALYDFGGEATVTGSGSAVPIPPTVMLLGSGLLGLVGLRLRPGAKRK